MSIANVFIGLAILGLGILIVRYTQNIYNFTGGLDFIENIFHAGTPTFLRLTGIVLVVFGLGMIFGIWNWLTQPIADALKNLTGANLKK